MPPTRLDAVGAAVTLLARVRDPRERLAAIERVRAELSSHAERLDHLRGEAILELRSLDTPATFAEIGELLNVSAQRAYQLAAEHLSTTSTTTKGTTR
jgi:DNA-directed RNA polymerase sigma subunit (sigma70/sigma32)